MEDGGIDWGNVLADLLPGATGPEAAAFPGDGSSPPPPGSSQWVHSPRPAAFAHSPFQPLQLQGGGGSWAGDNGVSTERNLFTLIGDSFPEGHGLTLQAEGPSTFIGHQFIHGADGLPNQAGGAEESLDHMLLDGGSSGANQVGDEQTQVGANQVAAGPNQAGIDTLEPADYVSAAASDNQTLQVAQMIREAAQCSEDDAHTVWSEEEQEKLRWGLVSYAGQDSLTTCLRIANDLPKKTALDVALRWRWMQIKEKTATEAKLVKKDTAGGKVKKGKKTNGAKNNKKRYPLSKEALDSKITKELIRDNHMFLKQIEENLKAGQLDNTADYYCYVKTNLDAIEKRMSRFSIRMAMPPIDEEGLEEILRSSLSLLALGEAA